MAANRFATMLHKNTNKITLILIYAVLEWILIVLLLLNSLFSYLIIKFAEVFGLKPPCPWCTRIDHVFDAARGNNIKCMYLCEFHSKEISMLGFCSNHQKLVDSGDMCEECSSSRPEFEGSPRNFSVLRKMKGFGEFQRNPDKLGENGEVRLNCSCCRVSLANNDKCSSYILLKPSSCDDGLECSLKEYLIVEEGDYDDNLVQLPGLLADSCDNTKVLNNSSETNMNPEVEGHFEIAYKRTEENGYISANEKDNEIMEKNSTLIMKDKSQVCILEDGAVEIFPQQLEWFQGYRGHKLVRIELIDSVSEDHKVEKDANIEADDDMAKIQEIRMDSEVEIEVKEEVFVKSESQNLRAFLDFDINEKHNHAMLDSMDIEEDENSLVLHAKGSHLETDEFGNYRVFPLPLWPLEERSDVQEHTGTEREELSDIQAGLKQSKEQMVEAQSLSSITSRDHMTNNERWVHTELMEVEEDKVPDTQTSIGNLNLERSSSVLQKRDAVAEESLEESITSELDGLTGPITIECLKSALIAERMALQALCTELEEERSASAVATNQTMAMINRLQEEKAAMQMEALQYQRMMEEQSEYDQEALELLNELMVKREKEKQELERELEVYRKKLLDYEVREKQRCLGKSRDGSVRSVFSSASCSNTEDSDGLSFDLNQDVKEREGLYQNSEFMNQSTPNNAVVNLEESLEDFEEERLSILEQLKVLEGKLLILDDENEQRFEDVNENGHLNREEHRYIIGYPNGKHEKRERIIGQNGKSLLPLFDSISDENGGMMVIGNEFDSNGVHDSYELKVEMKNKKFFRIEEEVDHLYDRLQALEADREFVKHCMSALKKGDKGVDLLQEILLHLRDLRHLELRVRNLGDGAVI